MVRRGLLKGAAAPPIAIGAVALAVILASDSVFAQDDAATLYARNCAQCHDTGSPDIRAPSRDVMKGMSPESIVRVLDTGTMAPLARNLSLSERQAVAEYLTGNLIARTTGPNTSLETGQCQGVPKAFSRPFDIPGWNGWGGDETNRRFQSAEAAGITPQSVGRLKLKWAFGFAGAVSANA